MTMNNIRTQNNQLLLWIIQNLTVADATDFLPHSEQNQKVASYATHKDQEINFSFCFFIYRPNTI